MTPDFGFAAGCNKFSTKEKITKGNVKISEKNIYQFEK